MIYSTSQVLMKSLIKFCFGMGLYLLDILQMTKFSIWIVPDPTIYLRREQ